jgi:ribosomal protein S12 methylthiotransferase accessory factor
MEISVEFGGGRVVEASIGDHVVRTDQSAKDGGEGTAPSPSDLFLVSIAACAGYYVLNFCRERKIATAGSSIIMRTSTNEKTKMMDNIRIEIKLPPGFPEKYEKAVVRAANLCWVKKNIEHPPKFDTVIVR